MASPVRRLFRRPWPFRDVRRHVSREDRHRSRRAPRSRVVAAQRPLHPSHTRSRPAPSRASAAQAESRRRSPRTSCRRWRCRQSWPRGPFGPLAIDRRFRVEALPDLVRMAYLHQPPVGVGEIALLLVSRRTSQFVGSGRGSPRRFNFRHSTKRTWRVSDQSIRFGTNTREATGSGPHQGAPNLYFQCRYAASRYGIRKPCFPTTRFGCHPALRGTSQIRQQVTGSSLKFILFSPC